MTPALSATADLPRSSWRLAGARRLLGRVALVAPLVAFLVLLCVYPLALLLGESLHATDAYGQSTGGLSLAQYDAVVNTGLLRNALWNSLKLSIEVTAISVVIGLPAAAALAGAQSRWLRAGLYTIVVSPLLTSVIVRTYAWIIALSTNGPIHHTLEIVSNPGVILFTYPATLIAVTHVLVPFMILPLASSFTTLDPDLRKASATLGAGPVQTFLRITLPAIAPGLVTGILLVFTLTMGIYVTPLLVGGTTQPLTATMVYVQALSLFNVPLAGALSVALLVLMFAAAGGLILWFRRWEARNVA